jgi:hypothetical protein
MEGQPWLELELTGEGKEEGERGPPLGGGIGAARGRHGEGLLGVAPCSWLLCGPSASSGRTEREKEEEEREKKKKRKEKKRKIWKIFQTQKFSGRKIKDNL